MTKPITRKLRCAVYTRKSSEEGLEQEFNSLHAQREACESCVASQRSEGWALIREPYDDGGFSGGTLERPALKRLLADIEEGHIDVVVVYKIDRLSRSLMDFSKLVEVFDRAGVTFVSVTQSFNTTTSMGRLTLNILLSFAQNLTGRLRLIQMARDYDREVAAGRDFWEVMVERYRLRLDVVRGSLDNIPATGPVVVVSNHPYGILDGLMLGYMLAITRGDFRILAHRVFRKARELDRVILPISFDESAEATALNLETRKIALDYLADGGCIGIFPGGTVSTALKPFGQPMDPSWGRFTARLIKRSGAQVVPIYFEGHNSRLFQLASHLHYTLRMALLINEFKTRVGGAVPVAVGEPLDPAVLDSFAGDARGLMDHLRAQTYRLSRRPITDLSYGFEFEDVR